MAWNFTTEMFTFTQTGTTTIKLSKTSTSKHQNNYYTNFVSGLFPVKIKKKPRVVLL
jgi:hypothetical protein